MNQEQGRRIKVAHFSDLHFSIGNLLEAGRCFGHAVSTAISEGVDVAIISGDLTDHKQDAHSAALHRLMQEIRRLADHCPVLILQGTFLHDYPGCWPSTALRVAGTPWRLSTGSDRWP